MLFHYENNMDMKNHLYFIVCLWMLLGVSLWCPGQLMAQDATSHVDKPAVLRGSGNDAGGYYAKRFVFPIRAIIELQEGAVAVAVAINAEGAVESVDVLQGLTPEIDESVRQLVMTTGKWKPAKLNKEAVRSVQNITINLRLSDSQRAFSESLKAYRGAEHFPLFVLDRKLVNDYVELEPYNIKSIRVLKGEKATELYGEAGSYGVVEIQTKRGTPPIY